MREPLKTRRPHGGCGRRPEHVRGSRALGRHEPVGVPFFIVTHRTGEQPEGDDFVFVDGLAEAIEQATQAAGDKDVSLGGGADVIRQALEQGLVDSLSIIIAPVILAGSGCSRGSPKTSSWSTSACASRSTPPSSTTR